MNSYQYAVSFEYDTRPVQTSRDTVYAAQVASGCRIAVKKAILAQGPKRWRSVVVVLERSAGAEPKRKAKAKETGRDETSLNP